MFLVLAPILLLAALAVGYGLGRRTWRPQDIPPHPYPTIPWDELDRHAPEAALVHLASLPPSAWTAEAWECRVAALRRMGAVELAWSATEEGLRSQESFGLWMERHALAVERGAIEPAAQALEAAACLLSASGARAADRAEWLLRKAEFALLDQRDAAAAWKALESFPKPFLTEEAVQLQVQTLLSLERFLEAEAILDQHPWDKPLAPPLMLLRAECAGGLGQWTQVRELLAALPGDWLNRPECLHLQGVAAANLGEKLNARDLLELAVESDPHHPPYRLDAAQAWLDLGEFTQAERQARQALRQDPSAEGAFLLLAECRQGLQDLEGARRLLRECLLRHPESTEAQHALAQLEAQ